MSRCLELWLFLFNKYFWIGILIPEPTSTWFQYASGLDLPSYHVMLYAFLGKPPCQIHFKNAWHVALANSRCHVTFCVWVIGYNSQYVPYSFPSQFCWMMGKRVLYVLDPIFFFLKTITEASLRANKGQVSLRTSVYWQACKSWSVLVLLVKSQQVTKMFI